MTIAISKAKTAQLKKLEKYFNFSIKSKRCLPYSKIKYTTKPIAISKARKIHEGNLKNSNFFNLLLLFFLSEGGFFVKDSHLLNQGRLAGLACA